MFLLILQIIYSTRPHANGSDNFSRFAERLLNQFNKLFLFTRYPEVECTNNAAERTLRHIVLWRKTSYGTQSNEGSRFLERAVSIWMTLKKQSRKVMPYFLQAYLASYTNPRKKLHEFGLGNVTDLNHRFETHVFKYE